LDLPQNINKGKAHTSDTRVQITNLASLMVLDCLRWFPSPTSLKVYQTGHQTGNHLKAAN